jgi:hypothetical protein
VARKSKVSNAELKRHLPQTRSTIGPLPYYPELRRMLRWHGPAILLVYLEIHHPEIQSPLLVDLRRIQVDLVVGRELFWTYFNPLGTVFQKPEDLWRAQRAGREFIRPDHQYNGVWRCYSLTRVREDIYELRRNKLLIQDLIVNCTPTAKLSPPDELPAIPPTDTAQPEESGRFTTLSQETPLEEAREEFGVGPAAAAGKLVAAIWTASPQAVDRRRSTSPGNLARGRKVALAKSTPEGRSAKARAAALARYNESRKARGNTGNARIAKLSDTKPKPADTQTS